MAEPTRDWQRYLKSRQGDPGPHLAEETLLAYHEGRLQPAEDEAIQEHLVGCRLCARILLELVEVPEDFPVFEESAAAVAPDWAPLRAELAKDGWFDEPRPEPAAPEISWWRRLLSPPAPMRWAYAGLAAVLLVTSVLALPLQKVPLQEPTRSADLSEVQLSIWIRGVIFVLPAVPLPDSPDFQIQLLDSEKRTVFERRGVRPRVDGTIWVTVPRWKLSEGSYILELEGLEAGRAVPIETFSVFLKGSS